MRSECYEMLMFALGMLAGLIMVLLLIFWPALKLFRQPPPDLIGGRD